MLQIQYLLSRALSGYVFVVPGLIVYFLLLSVFHRKQNPFHIITAYIFSFYLLFIIAATGIGNTTISSFSPEILLIPFRDIYIAPMHFLLNIIAFVPFGFFLPLLYKRFHSIKSVAITGFLFSLSIELVQMLGWGATETDDLIANTLGVCLGYCFYCLTRKCMRKDLGKLFQAVNIRDAAELSLLSGSTFLIMALVQPLMYNAFF